jgi:hypothetical protein
MDAPEAQRNCVVEVVETKNQKETQDSPLVIAFYLPQFHQIPENDAWHEGGFTEWTVVARSKPLYPGHRQPELPGELGFYDLRVPETRLLQARLAREHGISGFLYYHYWFKGRQMLSRPLNEVLRSGRPDFPFALCWANESWYRRWQGTKDELLVEQEFDEADDIAHIRWLIECFKDPRYIRIEDRPLLAVYRAQLFPDPLRTVELWRKECEAAGVVPPWLVMFETLDTLGDPAELGFDASAEFVPHLLHGLLEPQPSAPGRGLANTVYRYEDVASAYSNRPSPSWTRYSCVATAWDNSPRRQLGEALILEGSTPEGYGHWLSQAVRRQKEQAPGKPGVVFVNAWNEWAEGAHLEPDAFWGRAYLEATRKVLVEEHGVQVPEHDESEVPSDALPAEELYAELYDRFVALQSSASGFLSYADRRLKEWQKYYEGRLAEAREETRAIARMNQELVDQLAFQSQSAEEYDSATDRSE